MWITRSEAAARLGVDPRRITYLVSKGRIKSNGRKGKFLRVWYDDPAEKRRPDEGVTLDEIEKRRRTADAHLKELKAADIQREMQHKSVLLVEECIQESFKDYAQFLRSINLPEAERQKLIEVYESCEMKLSNGLGERLDALYDLR